MKEIPSAVESSTVMESSIKSRVRPIALSSKLGGLAISEERYPLRTGKSECRGNVELSIRSRKILNVCSEQRELDKRVLISADRDALGNFGRNQRRGFPVRR